MHHKLLQEQAPTNESFTIIHLICIRPTRPADMWSVFLRCLVSLICKHMPEVEEALATIVAHGKFLDPQTLRKRLKNWEKYDVTHAASDFVSHVSRQLGFCWNMKHRGCLFLFLNTTYGLYCGFF